MRVPKIPLLLAPLFLAACASSSTQQAVSVPASVLPSSVASVEAKSPEPTPSIIPTKIPDVAELDEIEPALIAKQAKLKVHFKTQFSQSCALEMKYPQISGLADSTWQTQLNEILRQAMMEKMGASEPMFDRDKCKKVTRKPGDLRTRTRYCKVHLAKDQLVSISCLNLTTLGAYPHPREHSITFDLATGRIYQPADLFKPDSNYTTRLAVAMRDAWWESRRPPILFPFKSLETRPSFDFYLQEDCPDKRYDDSPSWNLRVCMVINNLGSGTTRNYAMTVRLKEMKDKLDTSGALKVLVDKID